RGSAGLGMKAKHLAARIASAEAVAHHLCPDLSGSAELRHLLEEVVADVEEEGYAGSEAVHRQPRIDRRLHIGDAVADGEGDLLGGRGPSLAHVVAADADAVPSRQALGAVGEGV